MSEITACQARSILSYDAENGDLDWRVAPCRRMKPGDKAGSPDGRGYRAVRINHKSYRSHRLAWLIYFGEWPDGEIDHIDGVRDNNAIKNLRVVDSGGNHKNYFMTDRNSSGCVGVSWVKRRSNWSAKITSGGPTIWLGSFDTIFEAACARKSAELIHGFHENHGVLAPHHKGAQP